MRASEKKSRTAKITRAQALECIPVRFDKVTETRLEDGEVVLTYPLGIRRWLVPLMRRMGVSPWRTPTRNFLLDRMGTATWDLIDGRHSVREVVRGVGRKFRLQPREAEVAVTRFLRELGKRGLIGMK